MSGNGAGDRIRTGGVQLGKLVARPISADTGMVYDSDSGRVSLGVSNVAQNDPDLQRVVGTWALLPAAVRAGIIAMIDAVGTADSEY